MCISRRRALGWRGLRRNLAWAAFAVAYGTFIAGGFLAVSPRAAWAQAPAEASDEEYQASSDQPTPVAAGKKPRPTGGQSLNWQKAGSASISKRSLSKPGEGDEQPGQLEPSDHDPLEPLSPPAHRTSAVMSDSLDALPNEAGQILRTYNIRPYTMRVTSTNRPEQAIVDWILRETGYEAWHSEPVALLCADASRLIVYHTPEVQSVVAEVVDRFVNTEAESQAFSLRVVTIGHPDWRAKAHAILHPVPVQTQGIQAWLVHKEDVALMLDDLRKRSDFREHSSPHLLVNNGQSTTVSAIRPRIFVRDILVHPEIWPGYEPEQTQFDEGFSLELSPLLSLDGRTVDSVIKCNIDQLERLVPVKLPVPTAVTPRQQVAIDVPQITHCRLHERFRWPADQVLLVGMGVVATPVPDRQPGLLSSLPLLNSPPRADLLVFVESKGQLAATAQTVRTSARDARTYHGRY